MKNVATLSIMIGLLLVVSGIGTQYYANMSILGLLTPHSATITSTSSSYQIFTTDNGFESESEFAWFINDNIYDPYTTPWLEQLAPNQIKIYGSIGEGTYNIRCDFIILYGAEVGTTNTATLYVTGSAPPTPTPTPTPTPATQYSLTIGLSGQGTTNPTAGLYYYIAGATVPISASASNGWKFSKWLFDDGQTSTNPSVTLTMSRSRTTLAVFVLDSPTPTPTPTPVPTPVGQTPDPNATPTPAPTPTPTPIPSPTPIPLPSPTPTPSPTNYPTTYPFPTPTPEPDKNVLKNAGYLQVLAGIAMVLFGLGRRFGGKQH